MSTRSKVLALVALGAAAVGVIAIARHFREPPAPAPAPSASTAASPVDAGAPDAAADVTELADASAEDADANAPRDCDRFRAANEAMIARIAAAEPACKVDVGGMRDAFTHCAEADAGVWSLLADRFSIEHEPSAQDPHACAGITVDVALVHVDRAGAEQKIYPLRDPGTKGGRAENWSLVANWGSRQIDPPVFFDFDGDGDLEVIVTGSANDEGPDPSWHEAWTYKLGRIIPYPPLAKVAFETVADVDGDGRPDVWTRGPYAHIEAGSALGGMWPVAPPIFLLHSEKDGSFDGSGAIARAELKKACPQKPELADAGDLDHVDDVVSAIVCARAWGASEREVRAALAPHCGSMCSMHPQDCGPDAGPDRCPDWLDPAVRVTPRLLLR